ncbi:hypothetical protein PMAYCL1PPCAC_25208, partial [Pristionchus mayeri]
MHVQKTSWSIALDADLILVHPDSDNDIIVKISPKIGKDWNHAEEDVMTYSEILSNREGLIRDDKVTVEVRLWISKMKGVKIDVIRRAINFTDASEPYHDITLVIGEEKIYVSKQILAFHSPVFKAMFYGEFAEKNKNE